MYCLKNKPKFGIKEMIWTVKHTRWNEVKLWQIPFVFVVLLFATIWAMATWFIYWFTLPLAFINELVRDYNMI